MIPREEVQRIKQAADIVRVIGESVELRRTTASYIGNCPFHPDKKKKFTVSPSHNTYKCWSCGESGDVFAFIMNHEGRKFEDAVDRVCALSGIASPRHS